MDDRREIVPNVKENKIRRLFRDVSLGLVAFIAAAAFAVAVRSYIPYSFFGYMTPALRRAPFIVLAPTAVVSGAALTVCELKLRFLGKAALYCSLALCAAVAVSPLILLADEWREALYAVDGLIFFFVPLAAYAVCVSIGSKLKPRILPALALSALCSVVLIASAVVIAAAFFKARILTAPAAAMMLPAVSLGGILLSVSRLLSPTGKVCKAAYFAALFVYCLAVCLLAAADFALPAAGVLCAVEGVWLAADTFERADLISKARKWLKKNIIDREG